MLPRQTKCVTSVFWEQRGEGAFFQEAVRVLLLVEGLNRPVVDTVMVPRFLFPMLFVERVSDAYRGVHMQDGVITFIFFLGGNSVSPSPSRLAGWSSSAIAARAQDC
jgi:hypothetical protein